MAPLRQLTREQPDIFLIVEKIPGQARQMLRSAGGSLPCSDRATAEGLSGRSELLLCAQARFGVVKRPRKDKNK
jgi:hypothetical protein